MEYFSCFPPLKFEKHVYGTNETSVSLEGKGFYAKISVPGFHQAEMIPVISGFVNYGVSKANFSMERRKNTLEFIPFTNLHGISLKVAVLPEKELIMSFVTEKTLKTGFLWDNKLIFSAKSSNSGKEVGFCTKTQIKKCDLALGTMFFLNNPIKATVHGILTVPNLKLGAMAVITNRLKSINTDIILKRGPLTLSASFDPLNKDYTIQTMLWSKAIQNLVFIKKQYMGFVTSIKNFSVSADTDMKFKCQLYKNFNDSKVTLTVSKDFCNSQHIRFGLFFDFKQTE